MWCPSSPLIPRASFAFILTQRRVRSSSRVDLRVGLLSDYQDVSYTNVISDMTSRTRYERVSLNTLFRSVAASIFPIALCRRCARNQAESSVYLRTNSFSRSLAASLASTVPVYASISVAMIPIHFIFIRFGPALRAGSRHAREAQEIIARMRQ